MMTKLILASASPRRREILDMAGFAFAVCPARGEEVRVGADPVEIVENLAKAKAREVAGSQKEDCLVLGADTIVVLDGEIMGKPADRADASRMLHALQGRSHQVYTGVALDAVRQGVYCAQFRAADRRVCLSDDGRGDRSLYGHRGTL